MTDRESQAAELFARHRAEPTMRATVTNLRTIAAKRVPHCLDAAGGNGAALIIGAGPSLADSLDWIREASDSMTTIAVNAAARAVADAGIRLDVVVSRESLDVSAHLDVPAGLLALDLTTHPGAFERAAETTRAAWFTACCTQHVAITHAMGVRGVFAGPSALTAAVALAQRWGHKSIVLVGAPLAMVGGRAYGPESAWGEVRGSMRDDHVALDGLETMWAAHDAIGATRTPEYQATTRVPAWDGSGEVVALWTWEDQRQWLMEFARLHAASSLYNATHAGADVPGWENAGRHLHTHGRAHAQAFGARRVYADPSDALRMVLEDASYERDVQQSMSGWDPPPIHMASGVLSAMAAGSSLDIREMHHTVRRRVDAGYRGRLVHAAWIAEQFR